MEKKKRRKWTIEEDNYLIANYSDAPVEQLLSDLDRTYYGLMGRVQLLGLKRSLEYLRSVVPAEFIERGKKTRLKKGGRAWNKGTKGLMSANEGSFKEGAIPHNWKPIGSERITRDGYVEVKYKDERNARTNYELKHRLIWIEKNGPVPKGCVIIFKDGNARNFEDDNLAMLTMRENMIRNMFSDISIAKRFFDTEDIENEEIKALIRLKRAELKLKQKLKEYESK